MRRQLFEATGDSQLTPCGLHGNDSGFNIKHPESLVNFIAAYGVHAIAADTRDDGGAEADGGAGPHGQSRLHVRPGGRARGRPHRPVDGGSRREELHRSGACWARRSTTSSRLTLENLQNADRFYYLERLDGLNLLAQMEGNSFSEPDLPATPPLKNTSRRMCSRVPISFWNLTSILEDRPGVISDDPSTPEHNEGDHARFRAPPEWDAPVFLGPAGMWSGTAPSSVWGPTGFVSSEGDDTLRGDNGNDVSKGGAGNDSQYRRRRRRHPAGYVRR